jgi:bifunctional UDP-N-acetylglucosamine pyrophosphorylase/glucosamine-1-phosphate N-acetyltransferase
MTLQVIILAAGKGTRMKSNKPKVLHEIAGKPMIEFIIDTARKLEPSKISVIYGYGGEQIKKRITGDDLSFVCQSEQLGTAHAVMQALPNIDSSDDILVLYGDTPFVCEETLRKVIETNSGKGLTVLTAEVQDPFGLGRIVRSGDGKFEKIVEQKDASPEETKIREINTGICYGSADIFKRYINQIENKNNQKEFYLVDIFAIALKDGVDVSTYTTKEESDMYGINNHKQQANLERLYQLRQAEKLMEQGVTIIDPNRFDLRGNLTCGTDVVIDINVIFEGNVKIGNNVKIGAGCVISNCEIADNSVISPYSVLESSKLGRTNTIGPFAHLRPNCELEDEVHVGNFVEVKKSTIAHGTKAGHLTYIGDSQVGSNVNFGAGTITCNYDGANKHKTVIGNDVFIGSDTQLVAPVEIGDGATIGAGSTITKKVGEKDLVITRVPQRHIAGWIRPQKKNK